MRPVCSKGVLFNETILRSRTRTVILRQPLIIALSPYYIFEYGVIQGFAGNLMTKGPSRL